MRHLAQILRFGWPYLRRYARRFLAGFALAILFGLSNGLLLWAINTMLGRLTPHEAPAEAAATAGLFAQAKAWLEIVSRQLADVWLPQMGTPPTWRQILGGLFLFPCLAMLRGFSGYLSSYCLAWVSERVVNDLRLDVFRKLTDLSLDFHNRSTMGDLVTRVNGDTTSLQRCLSLGLSDLVKEPVTIVGVLCCLFVIDGRLTLITMVFFPLLMVPILVFGRRVRKAATAGLKTSITQSSLLLEMLSGIRIVKAFNLEPQQVDRFHRLSRELLHHTMRWVRAKEIINPLIEAVSTFGFGVIIVYIVYRQIALEDIVSLVAGAAFIYTPIKKLAAVHMLLQQTDAGVQRLMQILGEQPSVKEKIAPHPMAEFRSDLRFDRVTFTYGHQPVLRDVDLVIPRGQRLGVAGESGSGKSTLLNLLFRFYDPTAGAVRIDGLDVRELSLADLRQRMALVSQEVVLFDLTVAENIACGRPGATAAEIEAAARAAFAHDFIQQLPAGYQTRIGERGVTLSGGQRQRIAIARAFVRDAPILVLDEATASLDSQSEAEVQAAVDRLVKNRTVICVAHRLSTLANLDRIIVLSRGEVVEEGNFDELLRRGGPFAAMAAKQGLLASNGSNRNP